MILDLVRKLSTTDSTLSLSIHYSDDGVITFGVDDNIGNYTIYSYSSTDVSECYSKVLDFIECLEDGDKFFNLLKRIEEEPLEV